MFVTCIRVPELVETGDADLDRFKIDVFFDFEFLSIFRDNEVFA